MADVVFQKIDVLMDCMSANLRVPGEKLFDCLCSQDSRNFSLLSSLLCSMIQSVYLFRKEGQRWRLSRLDKWHAEPGSAWKRCGSTSARACWRNRRAVPLAIGSTPRRWSHVSALLNARNS